MTEMRKGSAVTAGAVWSIVTAGLLIVLLWTALARAEPTPRPPATQLVEMAGKEFGAMGQRAATFLVKHMPGRDRETLTAQFLMTNLRLAFVAREKFPWARKLPEERFFNDVLPYAVLDETREPWRENMLRVAEGLVKGCATRSDAAQALNRGLFNTLKVHYNTSRQRPNQSPSESIAQGRATCTGLAILLVDACRAVGIPARVAGVARWSHKPGNHTWVEIWDGEWKFLGADEYDPQGLNRGWFVPDAAKAVASEPMHAVWASSWQSGDGFFPLVWDRENRAVAAVNVTSRYSAKTPVAADGKALVHLRVLGSAQKDKGADSRLVVTAQLRDASGKVLDTQQTKAGAADFNDMPGFRVAPGQYVLRLRRGDQTREAPLRIESASEQVVELRWEELSPPRPAGKLTRRQAAAAVKEAWEAIRREQAETRKRELDAKSITLGDKTLRWLERTEGDKPAAGYSLWISMHGGGNAPAAVNDAQWQNQIRLYHADGIWIAPRAPTDTWNLWHEAHIDPLFDRLIEDFVLLRGVHPNRVYLLGYSAGGDGVYQLAPRMADRFAAASMMSGHPNESSPLGLRNLPFAIFAGGEDSAYNRNKVAREWGERLDTLHKGDPGGYAHWTQVYEGLGHWMNGRDAEALPWMAKFTRNPWPRKVVWHQDDVTHDRFYWLALPEGAAKQGQTITAEANGRTIRITAEGLTRLTLRLSDALLDLDQPLTVLVNGKPVFKGQVPRTTDAITASLRQRAEPATAATAVLPLKW